MITLMRNKLQGLGFRIVMGFFLVLIAIVWVMPQVPQISRQFSHDWIVDINGQKILLQDFMRKYKLADAQLQSIKQQYGPYADYFLQSQGIPTDPQDIALNEITTESLLNQAAQTIPIDISAQYIEQKLKDRAFIQGSGLSQLLPPELIKDNGSIDLVLLRYYLQKMNMTVAQFEELLEYSLERFMLAELVGLAAYVPSFQVRDFITQQYAQKKYSLLVWPLKKMIEIEKKKGASDQALEQFYNEQSAAHKRYWIPEKRSGSYWVFSPESYGITLSNDEIKRYYDRNKSLFIKSPLQLQLRRILIKVGEQQQEEERYKTIKNIEQELKRDATQFEQLARQYSEDKETASKGGLIQPFAKGERNKQLEKIAFLLKNDGDVSNIFKTDEGFEIVQRVSKVPVTYKPLTSVADEIRKKLTEDLFAKQFAADFARVQKTSEEIESFAKKHNAQKKSAIDLAQEESSLSAALFGLKLDGITVVNDQNQGLIVQLKEIKKSYLPKFEQIKREVADDYYKDKALTSQRTQMIEAKKALLSGESLDVVSRRYEGAEIKETDWLDLESDAIKKYSDEMGIPMGYFAALEKIGGIFEYQNESQGYLIRLNYIKDLDERMYQEKKALAKEDLYRHEIRRNVEGFVASLHRNATIKFNESIIAKLKDRAS